MGNMGYIDTENQSSHRSIERLEDSAKVEAMRAEINHYRMEMNQRQVVPTFMVIEWLAKFEKVLDEQYAKQVANGELDKARNDYFLMFGKKPFLGWNAEEIRQKMEEYSSGNQLSEKSVLNIKSERKKSLNKNKQDEE